MKPILKEPVLAFFNANPDTQFQNAGLARQFNVGEKVMRKVIDRLVAGREIQSTVTGNRRLYFARPGIEERAVPRVFAWTKPLKGYEARMRAVAELAEGGR